MNEINIQENRFLSLIESEKELPKVISAFISYLVMVWKISNTYTTQDDRKPLIKYIQDEMSFVGYKYDFWFNNTYNNCIMFRYAQEDYFIGVCDIDVSTGNATNKH